MSEESKSDSPNLLALAQDICEMLDNPRGYLDRDNASFLSKAIWLAENSHQKIDGLDKEELEKITAVGDYYLTIGKKLATLIQAINQQTDQEGRFDVLIYLFSHAFEDVDKDKLSKLANKANMLNAVFEFSSNDWITSSCRALQNIFCVAADKFDTPDYFNYEKRIEALRAYKDSERNSNTPLKIADRRQITRDLSSLTGELKKLKEEGDLGLHSREQSMSDFGDAPDENNALDDPQALEKKRIERGIKALGLELKIKVLLKHQREDGKERSETEQKLAELESLKKAWPVIKASQTNQSAKVVENYPLPQAPPTSTTKKVVASLNTEDGQINYFDLAQPLNRNNQKLGDNTKPFRHLFTDALFEQLSEKLDKQLKSDYPPVRLSTFLETELNSQAWHQAMRERLDDGRDTELFSFVHAAVVKKEKERVTFTEEEEKISREKIVQLRSQLADAAITPRIEKQDGSSEQKDEEIQSESDIEKLQREIENELRLKDEKTSTKQILEARLNYQLAQTVHPIKLFFKNINTIALLFILTTVMAIFLAGLTALFLFSLKLLSLLYIIITSAAAAVLTVVLMITFLTSALSIKKKQIALIILIALILSLTAITVLTLTGFFTPLMIPPSFLIKLAVVKMAVISVVALSALVILLWLSHLVMTFNQLNRKERFLRGRMLEDTKSYGYVFLLFGILFPLTVAVSVVLKTTAVNATIFAFIFHTHLALLVVIPAAGLSLALIGIGLHFCLENLKKEVLKGEIAHDPFVRKKIRGGSTSDVLEQQRNQRQPQQADEIVHIVKDQNAARRSSIPTLVVSRSNSFLAEEARKKAQESSKLLEDPLDAEDPDIANSTSLTT